MAAGETSSGWAGGIHPGFFDKMAPMPLAEVAAALGATLPEGTAAGRLVHDVKALDEAGPDDIAFLDNRKYLPQLAATRAGACLIAPAMASRAPATTIAVTTAQPYVAFAKALALFYPDARYPSVLDGNADGPIAASARLEDGCIIQPGALIGPEARIGRGTVIAAGAVIGRRVTIGRDGFVGPSASVTHALIGDRVVIHAGARIGQDGFGFAMGPKGHLKVPQVGRVIVQDDVEIGANTAIDRGALKDTVIGEGTKIDNLVQIGHNVVIGRHCVIVAMVGLSGSTELGDFVVMGGASASVGHVKIGSGAVIAGRSGVTHDLPGGARYGGAPAKPMREWAREVATLARLAKRSSGADGGGDTGLE